MLETALLARSGKRLFEECQGQIEVALAKSGTPGGRESGKGLAGRSTVLPHGHAPLPLFLSTDPAAGLTFHELDEMPDLILSRGREVSEGANKVCFPRGELSWGGLMKELAHIHFENLQDLEQRLKADLVLSGLHPA